MSLHVVTLTSVWLFTSICVSGLWIHFHERKTAKPSTADVLPFVLLGRQEKGIWGRGKMEIHLPSSHCWELLGSVIWSSMLEITIGYPPLWVLHVQLMLTVGPWRAGLNTACVNGTNPLVSDVEAFSSPGHILVPAKIPSDQKLCCLHSQVMSLSVWQQPHFSVVGQQLWWSCSGWMVWVGKQQKGHSKGCGFEPVKTNASCIVVMTCWISCSQLPVTRKFNS